MDRGGPYAVKRLSLVNRGCERSKKTFDSGNDFLEGLGCVNQSGFSDETLPLNIFDPVLSEINVKNRSVQGDGRVSVSQYPAYRHQADLAHSGCLRCPVNGCPRASSRNLPLG